MHRPLFALLPLLALSGGCEALGDLATATITGKVIVDGEEPGDLKFELYKFSDNQDAFDNSYCDEVEVEGDCYGRVKNNKLTSQTKPGGIVIDGKNFTLEEVPTDLGYVLLVTGTGKDLSCTSDVLGYDPETKVVTSKSAIAIDPEGGIDSFSAPEPARIRCTATEGPPSPPENVDPPEDDSDVGADGDIPEPAVTEWTSFRIVDKSGAVVADASTESVVADVACNDNFPPVLEVQGELAGAAGNVAYLRMQFGSGDDAEFRTLTMPMDNGIVNQPISLTGGYSVLQLDNNLRLDGDGESYTATFCERQDPPAQELLLLLSWDKDDTDVDLHVTSAGSEVAYYSLSQSFGDLDIDDIDGFGPETFTSSPGTSGNDYKVQVHYYSSHGNGDTNVTLRAVYVDPNGELCDVTSTQNMASYEWWDVARFGPGVPCPN